MPIGLGIGLNISLRGGLGSGFSLTAPVLAFVSATDPDSDNTQDLDITVTAPEVDDVLTVEWDDNSDFSSVADSDTYTIVSGDLIDFTGEITTGALADGLWYFRAKHSRGAVDSDWSDTISKTITTVAGPPTLAYVANASAANSGSTTTAAGISIGTELATRRVIVAVTVNASTGRTLSSATIAGVAATLHGSPSTQGGAHSIEFISAIVPTGTTGDIILTWSSTRFNSDRVFVFTVDDDDLTSPTPVLANASTAGGTSMTNSVNVSEGGFVIMAASWNNGTSKSQAGSGDTAVTDVVPNAAFIASYSGSSLAANAAWDGTISWTGSYAGAMQIATWR